MHACVNTYTCTCMCTCKQLCFSKTNPDARAKAEATGPPGERHIRHSMRDTYVTTVEEPYLESCGYNSGDAVDPGMMMVGYQAKDPDCASDAWVVQTPVTGGAGVAGTLGVLLQAL